MFDVEMEKVYPVSETLYLDELSKSNKVAGPIQIGM
jgi:hypothetical protein